MSTWKQLTFDELMSQEEKWAGMDKAAVSRSELLEIAREVAQWIARARANHEVTADDVQRKLIDLGWTPDQLGPAAGSIFCTAEWEWTGIWIPSIRVSNHARMLKVWRLLDGS